MPWSTREIADLAGTSLRAVRHYHEVGLLDEPERHGSGLQADAPHGPRFVEQSLGEAMKDLYNPAQLDVVQRTEVLLRAATTSEDTAR